MRNSKRSNAIRLGYRSGLEETVAQDLLRDTRPYTYEKVKIEWEDLAYRTYTPDFVLHNNVIIETKGRFTVGDRSKHLVIKKQHPLLDIRFVFSNSRAKLYKGAKSTYAQWCQKYGFLYSDVSIPKQWLDEPIQDAIPAFVHFPEERKKR